jgi:hypothetical protein
MPAPSMQALRRRPQQPMLNGTDDPLGLGLRQRAREYRQGYEDDNRELAKQHGQLVSFSHIGPLKDSAWDAWQQALDEQGVDNLADASVGAKKFGWSPMGPGALSQSRFGESTTFDENQVGLDERAPFAQAPLRGRPSLRGLSARGGY